MKELISRVFSSTKKQQDPMADPTWRPENSQYLTRFPDMSLIWSVDIRHCIDDIVVNKTARDLLPNKDKYLASEDFFKDTALMTAPPNHSTAVHISPRYWNRALTVAGDNIPYNDQIGRFIMLKGTSYSGKSYGNMQSRFTDMPWGFFGLNEAKKELDIGNALLTTGFRASLPLGFAILKYNMLKATIEHIWRDSPKLRDNIIERLTIIEENKDVPAILGRVTGSTMRIGEYEINKNNFFEAVQSLGTLRNVRESLVQKITNGSRLDNLDMDALGEGFSYVVDRNINALRTLRNTTHLTDTYFNLPYVLSEEKDIDASFSVQDYESMLPYYEERPVPKTDMFHAYKTRFTNSSAWHLHRLFAYRYNGQYANQVVTQVLSHIRS